MSTTPTFTFSPESPSSTIETAMAAAMSTDHAPDNQALTATALLTDHSDEEDPMAQGVSDLIVADFDMVDYPSPPATTLRPTTTGSPRTHSSPIPAPAPAPANDHDSDSDFEQVTPADVLEADAAYAHEQHVRAMANHIVPPYPIHAEHADIQDVLSRPGRKEQIKRFELFIKANYPDECYMRSKDKLARAIERFPSDEMKIVHMQGETHTVSKGNSYIKCDETCPGPGKGWLRALTRASKQTPE